MQSQPAPERTVLQKASDLAFRVLHPMILMIIGYIAVFIIIYICKCDDATKVKYIGYTGLIIVIDYVIFHIYLHFERKRFMKQMEEEVMKQELPSMPPITTPPMIASPPVNETPVVPLPVPAPPVVTPTIPSTSTPTPPS
jgi:hypothetical protein